MKRCLILLALVALGCSPPPPRVGTGAPSPGPVTGPGTGDGAGPAPVAGQLRVTSSSFQDGQPIPAGGNQPVIQWSGIPSGTLSIAVEMLDPDVSPTSPFVHLLVANVDPTATSLTGGVLGQNGSGANGYYPPDPPPGPPHHYFIKVFALSHQLQLGQGFSLSDLDNAMKGNVLAQGQMMGTFQVNQ